MKASDCTACKTRKCWLPASRSCFACPVGAYNSLDTSVRHCTVFPTGKYKAFTGIYAEVMYRLNAPARLCVYLHLTRSLIASANSSTDKSVCADCLVKTYNELTTRTVSPVPGCLTGGSKIAATVASDVNTSCTCNNGYSGPAMVSSETSLTYTACPDAGKNRESEKGHTDCTDRTGSTYNALTAKTVSFYCLNCGINAASAVDSGAKTCGTRKNEYWGPAMGDGASLTCPDASKYIQPENGTSKSGPVAAVNARWQYSFPFQYSMHARHQKLLGISSRKGKFRAQLELTAAGGETASGAACVVTYNFTNTATARSMLGLSVSAAIANSVWSITYAAMTKPGTVLCGVPNGTDLLTVEVPSFSFKSIQQSMQVMPCPLCPVCIFNSFCCVASGR